VDREVNPAALTVEQVARLLTAAGGGAVSVEAVRRHIERGAPTSADGRVNLVCYAAWLVRECSGDRGR